MLSKRRSLKFFGLLCFAVWSLQFSACKDEKKSTVVTPITIEFQKEGELQLKKAKTDSVVATLDIEIADDAYQTQTGLMYRKSMAAHQGMLFIFPDSAMRSFYMKNTQIALDIIYLDENKAIVSIQKNAKPMNETSLPSVAPAKYVLEVNAGLSTTWGLEKDDVIAFSTN